MTIDDSFSVQRQRRISQTQLILEQIALLFASFIWTTVILSILVFFWAVQDVQANWNAVLGIPATPTAAPEVALLLVPTPTATPWPGPPPSPTPTETLIPSPTPTRVIPPPSILPDTPNQDDPTPIPVQVGAASEAAAVAPTPTPPPAAAAPLPPTVAPDPPSPPADAPPQPPTRLVIPSVGIDSAIIPVGWRLVEQNGRQFSIWEVADYAVGWHKTSAVPGQPGNMVMAGHHNIKGEVFRYLVNVEIGDEVIVYANDRPYTYTVELKTIVKEKGEPLEVRQRNAQWIAPTTDERLTMVTCWPYTNNTHRVIVVAKPG